MRKAQIKKQHRTGIKDLPPGKIVKLINELHLSMMVRVLYDVYGWRNGRIKNFMAAYMALFHEAHSGTITITQAIKDAESRTGININELLSSYTDDELKKIFGVDKEFPESGVINA